jgi:hypothetical protein
MIRPPIARLHVRQGGADGVKRGRQIDRDDRIPLLNRKVLHRRDVLDARVVHQDVYTAKHALGLRNHGRDFRGPRHVGTAVVDLDLVFGPNSATSSSICALSPKPFSTMCVPAAARARAIPRPMPLVEPVTSATLLERFMDFLSSTCFVRFRHATTGEHGVAVLLRQTGERKLPHSVAIAISSRDPRSAPAIARARNSHDKAGRHGAADAAAPATAPQIVTCPG